MSRFSNTFFCYCSSSVTASAELNILPNTRHFTDESLTQSVTVATTTNRQYSKYKIAYANKLVLAKVNVKLTCTYIAPSRETSKELRHGSQFYLHITPCLPLPRKRSPDDATTDL